MKNIALRIPYGKTYLECALPSERARVILHKKHRARASIKRLLAESFALFGAGEKLDRAIAGKQCILIVVPDATRSAHVKEILPFLLKRIDTPSRKIHIIVATGLHKAHTAKQLEGHLGRAITKNYKIINHAQGKGSLVNLGRTGNGTPIVLNRLVTQHDAILSVGVIEPHLYAGYSGGAKTVAIGLAGEATINATHSIRFLDHASTKIGSIHRNIFQNTLWEIIDAVRPGFSINTVNDPDGNALKIFSGTTREVFKKGVDFAKGVFEVTMRKPADIVVCGIGYPKDVNLYQASRAINYVVTVDKPVLRKKGVVIVAAELVHGIGEGVSEKRFYEELKYMASPAEFVRHIKNIGCIAGVHRAYMVAKALVDYHVVFVTRGHKAFMEDLPFPCFEDMAKAIEYAEEIAGKKSTIYVIPHALSTIPTLSSRA